MSFFIGSTKICGYGGVASIRIIRKCYIDLNVINSSMNTFFDTESKVFKSILPTTNAQKWVELDCEYSDIRRDITQKEGQYVFDTVLSRVRFQKSLRHIVDTLFGQDFVIATLYQNGRIFIDGLDYFFNSDRFLYTQKRGINIENVAMTSGLYGSDEKENLSFDIVGVTQYGGYLANVNWKDFETDLFFSNGVYSVGGNVIYITAQGNPYSW